MKKTTKHLIYLFIFLSSSSVFAQQKITLLHTNDIHGNFTSREARSSENGEKLTYGGFIALKHYVDQVKKETDSNYLLFDAGDFMTGTPICDIQYQGAYGGALVAFLNYLDYDGLTLGNHEFDISVANAEALMWLCDFPVFSANLFKKNGKLFTDKAYHIYEKNGMKIGVIGIIVHDLSPLLNKTQQKQIYTVGAVEIINKIAERIDDETDVIVVLSHSGIELDRMIAGQLTDKVDIIIGGHSHTRLKKPEVVNEIIIVQAGSQCANLGRLDITVQDDRVVSYDGKLIFLDNENIIEDRYLVEEVKKYNQMINDQYGNVIAQLKSDWIRSSTGESNIGNYLCDRVREYTASDIAVMNSGGIRKGLVAGPVTGLDIKEILPFNNQICITKLNGDQIRRIVETNVNGSHEQHSGILQVSGIAYQYKINKSNKPEVVKILIGGKPIEPDKTYTLATVDYVLANADQYFGFDTPKYENLYAPAAETVINLTKQIGVIDTRVEGRIVELK